MIRGLAAYLGAVPAVFIDGILYAAIAFLTFSQAYLGGDEAAKYLSPMAKFWINYAVGGTAALCGSLKMFRSTGYSDHVQEKKRNGQTEFFKKPPEPKE